MFNLRKAVFLSGASLCLSLFSMSAQAETLHEAVQTALQNHPSIYAAQASMITAREQRAEERSNYFPQFSASVSGGRMFANSSTSRGLTVDRGEAYSWMLEGNASLTQPIFDGMETSNRVGAASARQEAAGLSVADTQENIALRTAQAYVELLQAQETVQRIHLYKTKLKDYLSKIELLVDEGAADDVEAAQARNINLLLDETLAQGEGQVEAALASYKEIVGRMPESKLEKPSAGHALLFDTVSDAHIFAKENHPLILSSLEEIKASEHDVKAESGTLLPDLDGELSYQQRDQKEEIGGELEDARALLRLSWNFATGGGDFARIRKTKAQRSEKMAQHQDTLRQVERDISLAYQAMRTAKKQKEIVAKREEITSTLFKTYQSQFEGARVRLLQVMQADNQLFGARLAHLNADYTVLLTEYAALASVGRLQQALMVSKDPVSVVPDVEAPQENIDPADNFPVKKVDGRAVRDGNFKGLITPKPASVSTSPSVSPAVDSKPELEPEIEMGEEKVKTYIDERVYPDLGE